jgi:hypothetical protein
MDCPEADRLSLAFAPLLGEAVDPPSLPSSAFVEYPPDLMDSHATDQCHDSTPAIAENSFATPIGIVKTRPRNEIEQRARDSPLCRSQFVQSLVDGLGNRSVCSRRSLLRPEFMASILAPVPGWTPPCRPSRRP